MPERDDPLHDIGQIAEGWFAHEIKGMKTVERSKRLIRHSRELLAEWRQGRTGKAGSEAGMELRKELALAEDHARRAEDLVARQREVVERLSNNGLPTGVAVSLLEKLEVSRANLIDHLHLIRRQVEEAGGGTRVEASKGQQSLNRRSSRGRRPGQAVPLQSMVDYLKCLSGQVWSVSTPCRHISVTVSTAFLRVYVRPETELKAICTSRGDVALSSVG